MSILVALGPPSSVKDNSTAPAVRRGHGSESGGPGIPASLDGQRAGGAEALKRTAGTAQLTLEEARQILDVQMGATWDVIEKKYHHLYKSNTATSHYLLSKVFRAKERIDQEFPDDSVEWKIMNGDSTEAAQKAAKEAAAVKAEKARGAKEAAPGGTAGAPGPGGDSSQSKSDTLS